MASNLLIEYIPYHQHSNDYQNIFIYNNSKRISLQLNFSLIIRHGVIPMSAIKFSAEKNIENLLQSLEDDYFFSHNQSSNAPSNECNPNLTESRLYDEKVRQKELQIVKKFLDTPCQCGVSCQEQLQLDEIISARSYFNLLSWREKGCFLLPLLESFKVNSKQSTSARATMQ